MIVVVWIFVLIFTQTFDPGYPAEMDSSIKALVADV